jgi:D-3-phosphoglycerate dehydrogenase
VNIVNAELVAKERGILINEQRSRETDSEEGYAALVTLRARVGRSGSRPPTPPAHQAPQEQVIQGYVSNNAPYITRLDKFRTNFVPEGHLLICRNFDSPGKIGVVGSRLGKAGVNIGFMSVAAVEPVEPGIGSKEGRKNEALMILGVDRMVQKDVMDELLGEGTGILEASVVTL